MSAREDNVELEDVFETADPALLPLAAATLEQAAIDYGYRSERNQLPVVFGHPAAFVGVEGAVTIVVRATDAARARDLLADLQKAAETGAPLGSVPAPAEVGTAPAPDGARTIRLVNADSGRTIGQITEDELDFLVGQLEEESSDDRDYFIDGPTIDLLAEAGADAGLVEMLRRAVDGTDGIEIGWDDI
jgi:processive 1,2-diacylglycerol beta-glucosyltransferase